MTWKALEAVDRRVIFLILIAGILAPMVFPLKMPIAVTPAPSKTPDPISAMLSEYGPCGSAGSPATTKQRRTPARATTA